MPWLLVTTTRCHSRTEVRYGVKAVQLKHRVVYSVDDVQYVSLPAGREMWLRDQPRPCDATRHYSVLGVQIMPTSTQHTMSQLNPQPGALFTRLSVRIC